MIKTKLELHMAALNTAVKTLAAKSEREVVGIVTADFDALNTDPKWFTLYSKTVSDHAYQFKCLAEMPLETTTGPQDNKTTDQSSPVVSGQ